MMKKIYTLTLDDDVPLSSRVIDDIKVICFLVYEDMNSFEDKKGHPVLLTNGISTNTLYETRLADEYTHHFKYNDITEANYEPFMIGDDSFAFTVSDGTITDETVLRSLEDAKRMINVEYNFKLETLTYEEDKHNKNRLVAIKKLCNMHKAKKEKKNGLTKTLKPIISMMHLF